MNIKKFVSSLLATTVALVTIGFIPVDAASVKIDKTTFPSKGLRTYVSENFDKNSDGVLSYAEIRNATHLNLYKTGTSSMTGIKYLTGLLDITIDEPAVKNLNLYYNTKVRFLDISGSSIKEVKNLSRTVIDAYCPNQYIFYNMNINRLNNKIFIFLKDYAANSSKFNLKYVSKNWSLSNLTVTKGAKRSGVYLTDYEDYNESLKPITMTYRQPDGDQIFMSMFLSIFDKPKSIRASVTSFSSVKLDWDEDWPADGTEVWRSTSKTGTYTKINLVDNGIKYGKNYGTSKSLKIGQTYYYKLRSYVNINGYKIYSSYSSPISIKPMLLEPTGIRVELVNSKKYIYNLKWSKVEGAQGYQIYRSTKRNGKYSRVATIDSGSRVAKSFTTSKTYSYKIRAYKVVNGKTYYSPFSTPYDVWWM